MSTTVHEGQVGARREGKDGDGDAGVSCVSLSNQLWGLFVEKKKEAKCENMR